MAPIGGAAKQRPRGRATRTTIARTEVRGPVHGGKTLSSIGYELVETPHRRILAKTLPGEPWRPTGARRSSGHVAGLSDGAERGGEKRQGIAHKRVAAERQVSRNRSNREPHGCTRDRDGMPGRGKGLPGKSPGSTTPGRRGGI